jgi:hypothetical protein
LYASCPSGSAVLAVTTVPGVREAMVGSGVATAVICASVAAVGAWATPPMREADGEGPCKNEGDEALG